jgi:hypothetical protein
MLVRRHITVSTVVAIVAAVATVGIAGCGLEPAGFAALAGPLGHQATAPAAPASQAPASAVPTVKATFTAAVTAIASFGSPPAAYEMSVMSAIQTQQPIPGYSATMISDLQTSGLAAIREYFGPPQTAAERSVLANAMTLDASPQVINLGSGIERVSFTSVTVEGPVATVIAQVTTWRRSVARQSLRGIWIWLTNAPVHIAHDTATLRHAPGGSWQIVKLTSVTVS